jgi:glycerol kinase
MGAGPYVVAIDSGTTSGRTLAFDGDGRCVAIAQKELTQSYPQPGWVEHDAAEIWRIQRETLATVARAVGAHNIAAIGVTNQRETVVVWDRHTGEPLAPAIVWQCRRTADRCRQLRADGVEAGLRARTGLLLDPYFSGTKLAWLLESDPALRAKASRGDALFGTIDTWLVWNLTGGAVHATDPSNASRTLLCNLHTRRWDDTLLALFGVPEALLPDIRPSGGDFGSTVLDGRTVPIRAVLGDQQAALYGQACFTSGAAKCTYGTGCFLLKNAGPTPPEPGDGILATIAWETADDVAYALEGSVFVAGAAIQWLRDGLGVIASAAESEALARSVQTTGGVVFVPAFAGLGAPHWNADARGMITGLTRGTTKAHLVRAALESIAFQTADLSDALGGLHALRVDGGATKNDFLMQFQADILGIPVERAAETEITAFGAALLAGRGAGTWESPQHTARLWRADRTFVPALSTSARVAARADWSRAVAYQRETL